MAASFAVAAQDPAGTPALLPLGGMAMGVTLCFLAAGAFLFAVLQTVESASTAPSPRERTGNGGGRGPARDSRDTVALPRVCWLLSSFFALGFTVLVVDVVMRLAPGASASVGAVAGIVVAVLQAVVFGMLAPAFGLHHRVAARRWLVPGARLVLAPVLWVARTAEGEGNSSSRSDRLDRDRELNLLPFIEGVDRLVVEEAVEMIDSVLEFAEATARDVMTSRTEVEGIPVGTPREELMRRLMKAEYSRQVVYEGTLDNIVGVLLAKEVLLNRPADPLSLMREPLRVAQSIRLPELLRLIRRSPSNFAVVQDPYGGTAGIVTMHDLFERVIGEHIEDEHEDEELWIDVDENGNASISGLVEVWEVNQELELDLDESIARSLGGYLMYRFGRLPSEGDVWVVNGGEFRVDRIENNRIEVIAFRRDPDARESVGLSVVEDDES
ncbi:MAG: magnesium and cobalt exporter, family [Candidatus Sumerlaeota bacterium]|nr:magnesium and cobalt exporter, family [Candidatus Sumerlaeota bacterium]